jgi:hypothetical protein
MTNAGSVMGGTGTATTTDAGTDSYFTALSDATINVHLGFRVRGQNHGNVPVVDRFSNIDLRISPPEIFTTAMEISSAPSRSWHHSEEWRELPRRDMTMIQPHSPKAIKIGGYLTEAKLSTALQQIVSNGWLGDQICVEGSRHRWDMSYQIDSKVMIVEYDGDEHYRHSLKIKADRAKDDIARKQGYSVVRFPYWVQLDRVTLEHYFGLEAQIDQSFPHGFITTKLFPASFCELGIERFRSELLALPGRVRDAVISSLRQHVAQHGLQYVLPNALVSII